MGRDRKPARGIGDGKKEGRREVKETTKMHEKHNVPREGQELGVKKHGAGSPPPPPPSTRNIFGREGSTS